MNNKILSVILVAGIATTGFAGISAANTGDTLREGNSQIRELIQKEKSGETLTAEEQATLETAKQNRSEGGHKGFGKRK